MSKSKFFNLLFDQNEKTCFARDAKGTRVKSVPGKSDVFFSINALHPTEDLAPSMPYHKPDKPRRADANVVTFRNFLIEIDDMPLGKQISYVKNLVPFSTAVYSGGKSYHFIISLETPCETYVEYMSIAERIAKHVPKLDPSCKNPSRLSRIPNVMRPDTGKAQELLFVGGRVPNRELLGILPNLKYNYESKYEPSSSGKRLVQVEIIEAIRAPSQRAESLGGRNQFFFWLGNRLREVEGWSQEWVKEKVDQAYNRLESTNGFPLEEAYTAARIGQCQKLNWE